LADLEHIIVIGGGIGAALAHDLTLRGFQVTLLEKGELLCGSTGRHHGLLHSGARYVLHDTATARECIIENQILKRLAPEALEQNDGLFVALNEEDMSFRDDFLEGCAIAGIKTSSITRELALELEPNLNPNLITAVRVPDATMDAWRLPMHFFATAKVNGADIRSFSEVIKIMTDGKTAIGVKVFDHKSHRTYSLKGDIIVNATGPWAHKTTSMLDVNIPLQPAPGVMVSLNRRLTNMVINRLHPAGDGDIIIPQRGLSLLGTSVWIADDPDHVGLPQNHIKRITKLCAAMVPQINNLRTHAAWSASRPLIVNDKSADPKKISRTFDCIDHAVEDGVDGFISIVGGKATTMRAMAEKTADLNCDKTGRQIECRTHKSALVGYRRFFAI
jgi:glycerol-3-phosphate dehydrogenase